MRKLKKVAVFAMCAMTMMTFMPQNVSAESDENTIKTSTPETKINWSGYAYLSDEAWCNIVTSDNLFRDSPTVVNKAGNKGDIRVRVLNEKGVVIIKSTRVSVGNQKKLDKIPFNSGTYTIQGIADKGKAGKYQISVD